VRVKQSLTEIEEAFREEAVEEERQRRAALRREAAERSRERRSDRVEKQGNIRFVGLVAALFLTAVLVTWMMFEALALLTAP
jgi:fatty acid desaturase